MLPICSSYLHVCVCTSDPTSVCLLKWSYLSQHSSPMTGGIDGSRHGDPDRDHRQMSRVPVNVEEAGGGMDSTC